MNLAPLAPDWKAAFDDIVAALPVAASRVYGERLKALVLFGSVARGSQRPDSDIDLLLIAEPLPASRKARFDEFAEIERLFDAARATAPKKAHTSSFRL